MKNVGPKYVHLQVFQTLALLMLLLAPRHLSAQNMDLVVHAAAEPPKDPLTYTWFHNTSDKTVSLFTGKVWEKIATDVSELKACQGYVFLERRGQKLVYDPDGGSSVKVNEYACFDYLVCIRAGNLVVFRGTNERTLVKVTVNAWKPCIRLSEPDTLEGEIVYCVPQWVEGMKETNCDAFRNWGMLSVDGRWKIAPQFDQPFRFDHGIAKVEHYGRQFEINEKGEFVE